MPPSNDGPRLSASETRLYGNFRNRLNLNSGVTLHDDGKVTIYSHRLVEGCLNDPRLGAHHPLRTSRLIFGGSLLDTDGSEGRRLRAAVAEVARPRVNDRLVGRINSHLNDTLTGATNLSDWAEGVCRSLPFVALSELLGLPEFCDPAFSARVEPFSEAIAGRSGIDPGILAARRALQRWLADHLHALEQGRQPGETPRRWVTLTNDEKLTNMLVLVVAATATTRAAATNLISHLATIPGSLQAVHSEPGSVSALVTESLRFQSPLISTARFSLQPMQLAGMHVPADAPIELCLASANRDDQAFEAADSWNPSRVKGRIMTFGSGPHRCLGEQVARLELELLASFVSTRFDRIDLNPSDPCADMGNIRLTCLQGLRGHAR